MRTKQILLWVIILSLAGLAVIGQPAQSATASAPMRSGVFLMASIDMACTGVVWYGTTCMQPYAGEFVVTALNGAEVTRVWTNFLGQAAVSLPPGRYLIGARTESVYPRAAPALLDVVADRYTYASLRLDAGPRGQSLAR
jgi:hypothetical protein